MNGCGQGADFIATGPIFFSELLLHAKAKMKKNSIKYFIDVILFVDVCSIAMIGLLLAFIIPEGRSGRGARYFLGLHRHDWGNIHLCFSILLLLLLIIHIWFNWTWVVQSSKRYLGRNWKNALGCISGAWIVVLAVACIVLKIV
jgi:hypothetical protein